MNAAAADRFAVVIPAYNEAATIADIVRRTLRFTELVIVVNDGSNDETAEVLQQLPVTVLNNEQNLGKGKSLMLGANHALKQGAEAVITLDGDGQHRPEDIPKLQEAAADKPDTIILAARTRNRSCAPPMRRFANRFADFWISWAAGYRIFDSQSGFRLYPAAIFQPCPTYSDKFVFESEILIDAAQHGIYSCSVDIDTVYHRNARDSHYHPAADTWSIILMVARKLLQRGLYPIGLLRSLGIWPRPQTKHPIL